MLLRISTKSAGPLCCGPGILLVMCYSSTLLCFVCTVLQYLQTKSPLFQPKLVMPDGVVPGSAAPTGLGEGPRAFSSGSHMEDPRLSLSRRLGRGSARNRLEACELSSRSGHGSAHRVIRISGVCLLPSGFVKPSPRDATWSDLRPACLIHRILFAEWKYEARIFP